MNSRFVKIRENRIKKLEMIRALGINPYPSKCADLTHTISHGRKLLGENVGIAGRVWGWRAHGGSIFADLRDQSGQIQVWFRKDKLGKDFNTLKLFDIGDFIGVRGNVIKTKASEVTVEVNNFTLLTKSLRPLPSIWHGLKDVEERYRQRYVDLLLNPEVREVFEKRAQIVKLLREYLDKQGFLEVGTPAFHPIYGGATAKPFITHHNALNADFFLRIADELYLKRLVVGGMEKVYEICTDFRNEGIDRWHNPEFTQLEFYWAYADYQDLMKMTEEMLFWLVKKVTGSTCLKYGKEEIDFSPPWKRISYREAMLRKTKIDIEQENTIFKLKKALKEQKIKLDLKKTPDVPTILEILYKKIVRPKLVDPVFLIDYPYFMRPLAKRKEDDSSKVESLQLIVAGGELVNAYSELNDPQDQRTRWEEDTKRAKEGVEEYQVIDEDYLRALEYGMPPTAGWGLGIDRLTAILTNRHSIKEVILFPTLRPKEK